MPKVQFTTKDNVVTALSEESKKDPRYLDKVSAVINHAVISFLQSKGYLGGEESQHTHQDTFE